MTRRTKERERAARRTPGAVLADALLWLAAAAGVVCAISVLAAVLFHVSLIMFKTGSMAPTIPAGSVALVREIPAGEVRIGDVVTIDRPGELPITHRVTRIAEPEAGSPTRSITMKGDANDAEDAEPYVVDTVRIVLGSVPALATVIVGFSNPLVLGGITVAATVLVTWAFWPRAVEGARSGAAAARQRRPRRPLTVTLAAGGLLALGSPFALPAPPAEAAPVESVVRSEYFALTSIGDPELMGGMVAGVPVLWQVGVSSEAPEPGAVRVGLSAEGPLRDADGMTVSVRACPQRWSGTTCAAGASTWLPQTPLAEATAPSAGLPMRQLATLEPVAERWLLVTAVLEADADPGASAELRVQVLGSGDGAETGPPDGGGGDGGDDGGVGAGGEEGGGSGGGGSDGAGAGGLAQSGVEGVVRWGAVALLAIGTGLAVARIGRREERPRGAAHGDGMRHG